MGFLPIKLTRGELFFWSFVLMIAICFLWMKYLPEFPLWGALIVSAVVGAILMKKA